MSFRRIVTYLLIFALISTGLPSASPMIQAATPQPAAVDSTSRGLRSNMRIAAPPRLNFPALAHPVSPAALTQSPVIDYCCR
jgi:hypothetical protein